MLLVEVGAMTGDRPRVTVCKRLLLSVFVTDEKQARWAPFVV